MMAELIGPKGKVLCVDVQQKMLDLLKVRAEKAKISNYELILGEFEDPKLPKGKVDLILIVDAYHEFTNPEAMLKKMRESLSDKGLMVLLEFRAEDDKVPIKPDHKMSKKQILKELTANGFKLAKSYDKLPWQHMMFFARDDSKKENKQSVRPFKSITFSDKPEHLQFQDELFVAFFFFQAVLKFGHLLFHSGNLLFAHINPHRKQLI